MKTEAHASVVRDLEDRKTDAWRKKLRYLPGAALYAYFEGQEFAFRDLAKQIREGDYQPFKTEVAG
jgi:hypothetical protein